MDGINLVDGVVAVVILLTALLGIVRGFVRQVFTLISWAGAGYIAILLFPLVNPWMREQISSPLLADIATSAGLYVLALIGLMILSYVLASMIQGSALTAIDRSLGFLFGIVFGAAIVSLLYMMVVWIWPEGNQPEWLLAAKTRPALALGADLVQQTLPGDMIPELTRKLEALQNPNALAETMQDTARTLQENIPSAAPDATDQQQLQQFLAPPPAPSEQP